MAQTHAVSLACSLVQQLHGEVAERVCRQMASKGLQSLSDIVRGSGLPEKQVGLMIGLTADANLPWHALALAQFSLLEGRVGCMAGRLIPVTSMQAMPWVLLTHAAMLALRPHAAMLVLRCARPSPAGPNTQPPLPLFPSPPLPLPGPSGPPAHAAAQLLLGLPAQGGPGHQECAATAHAV